MQGHHSRVRTIARRPTIHHRPASAPPCLARPSAGEREVGRPCSDLGEQDMERVAELMR